MDFNHGKALMLKTKKERGLSLPGQRAPRTRRREERKGKKLDRIVRINNQ